MICCGFGAVILFYMIISAQSGVERIRKTDDLTAQVSKLEEQVITGARNLVVLRNTLEKTQSETVSAASRATRLIEELRRDREEGSRYDEDTVARRARLEKLKADVKALDEARRRLEASAKVETPRGENVGTNRVLADRRFITGLKLKGRRILVLLDRSASMLDDDLVNIIKLRNSSETARRSALKWQRALAVTEWLGSQLPPGAQYQIYAFNTLAAPALAGTAGTWLSAADNAQVDKAVRALDLLIPQDGTSLANALRTIRELSPRPDQVVLITDGLPTQGTTPPAIRRFVNAGERARLFDEATRALNREIPIDVVLLPMKGDIPASHRFWTLARNTGGAFLMPSPDWP